MANVVSSEIEQEPLRSVRSTVKNFESVFVDNSISSSPDLKASHVPRGTVKTKFAWDQKFAGQSPPPNLKHSDVVPSSPELGSSENVGSMKSVAELREALQNSTRRAFQPIRCTDEPIGHISKSMMKSAENLSALEEKLVFHPPNASVRTVSDIRAALRKSRENLSEDDPSTASISLGSDRNNRPAIDESVLLSSNITGTPRVPRPAPRKSKLMKTTGNLERSQSFDDLLGSSEEVKITQKSTKSFGKADSICENTQCNNSMTPVQQSDTLSFSCSNAGSVHESSFITRQRSLDEEHGLSLKQQASSINDDVTNISAGTNAGNVYCDELYSGQLKVTDAEDKQWEIVEGSSNFMNNGNMLSETQSQCYNAISANDCTNNALFSSNVRQSMRLMTLESQNSHCNDSPSYSENSESPAVLCAGILSRTCSEKSSTWFTQEQEAEKEVEEEKSTRPSSNLFDENLGGCDSATLLGLTHEEIEYNNLAALLVENISEDQQNLSIIISPSDNKSAVQYVCPLFRRNPETLITVELSANQLCFVPSFSDFGPLKDAVLSKAACKLEALTSAKASVVDALKHLSSIEKELHALVKEKADDKHYKKYRLYIDELDMVLHLLLMLSGRLARLHNNICSLQSADDSTQQKKAMLSLRYEELMHKFEDASSLKQSIDERSAQVSVHLRSFLTPQEFSDYQRFVATKCNLCLAQQSLDDRLSQAEEQLKAVRACVAGNKFVCSQTTAVLDGGSRETVV